MLVKLCSRAVWVSLFTFLSFSSFQIEAREILLEGKASYYISTDQRFRDIYGGTGLYRLETNIQAWNDFYAWVNLGYMYASGDTNRGTHSHLHLVPLAFGVSYLFKCDPFVPYVGLGPLLAYSHINNGSSHVTRNQNGWGGGFQAKTGFLAYLTDSLFFDFFADYSFIRMSFNHGSKRTVNYKGDLSGFSFGAGLGYKF